MQRVSPTTPRWNRSETARDATVTHSISHDTKSSMSCCALAQRGMLCSSHPRPISASAPHGGGPVNLFAAHELFPNAE
jgi:hypothetical protein